MNLITIAMFAIVLLVSFGITAWAARAHAHHRGFLCRRKGFDGGAEWIALAGDWCSAAAFLGFTG
jgi:cation/acetate symporter